MRTGHREHLTRVSEGYASVMCYDSCDLKHGVTIGKVRLVVGGADVFEALTEDPWTSLGWSAPRSTTRSVTTIEADIAHGVWESQQSMVAT